MMKKLILTTMITAFAVTGASAIKIPKGIFRVSEDKEARTEAAENELAIAYIMFPESIQPS